MGKLRLEPKERGLTKERYNEVHSILIQAQQLAPESHVFYDLEDTEKSAEVRRDFVTVAEKEKISLTVRRLRGKNSLQIIFDSGAEPMPQRMSADEAHRRILDVLSSADGPMKKGEILEKATINTGAWNVRISELIDQGKVIRQGERRDTHYVLAK